VNTCFLEVYHRDIFTDQNNHMMGVSNTLISVIISTLQNITNCYTIIYYKQLPTWIKLSIKGSVSFGLDESNHKHTQNWYCIIGSNIGNFCFVAW